MSLIFGCHENERKEGGKGENAPTTFGEAKARLTVVDTRIPMVKLNDHWRVTQGSESFSAEVMHAILRKKSLHRLIGFESVEELVVLGQCLYSLCATSSVKW